MLRCMTAIVLNAENAKVGKVKGRQYVQTVRVCVYREDRWGKTKISEGIAIIV